MSLILQPHHQYKEEQRVEAVYPHANVTGHLVVLAESHEEMSSGDVIYGHDKANYSKQKDGALTKQTIMNDRI